jgi:uncharacterized protein YndB with AHSA1/START domain
MPRARASRRIPAAPAAVWKVAADPLSLPWWWPRVVRVEGAGGGRAFTEVLQTERGRQVRADFRVVEQDQGRRRVWAQELEGSPFERVFSSSVTELRVTPESATETTVTLELRQRLRGISRIGGPLAARAGRRQLREALAALERHVLGTDAP